MSQVLTSSFYPAFAAPKGQEVGVAKIADHVEHIADRIGRHQYAHLSLEAWLTISVGIGSDYDGIESTPKGLEDVSKYPNLVGYLSPHRG